MDERASPQVAVAPENAPSWLADAVRAGGGEVVPLAVADALVWAEPHDGAGLSAALREHHRIRWVQLPWAGIEDYVPHLDDDHVWTCGKGVYSEPVAEMALGLGLAGLRNLGPYARAGEWTGPVGTSLIGANVSIIGGGGIAESLVSMLRAFRSRITVVRRSPDHIDGADDVLAPDRLVDALSGADLVVLALPLTEETDGLIGADEFSAMEPHACLVNVARGRHVVTADLVRALRNGTIGSAGLDVTDPEPLPAGHPLWSLPNCIVTPHTGNTPEMAIPLLSERVRRNVRHFAEGRDLIGLVNVDLGY